MIVSRQKPNSEIFTFIGDLVFMTLSRKVVFTSRKCNRNC